MPTQTHPKAQALARMKMLALAVLVLVVALWVLAHIMGRTGAWGWVAAFAEAATVGALADWFAVTALFRHPLGVPIPHTAIVPRNRDRIAKAVSVFVRDKFLHHDVLQQQVKKYNPAQKLAALCADAERMQAVSTQLQLALAHVANQADAATMQHWQRHAHITLRRQLRSWRMTPLFSQLLQALAQDPQHQRLLNLALEQVAHWVGSPPIRSLIADKMQAVARREYPKMVWLTDKLDYTEAIAENLADRMAQSLLDEVQAVLSDAQHPLRGQYAQAIMQWLHNLQHDAAMQAQVEHWKNRMLNHPDFKEYVAQRGHKWMRFLQKDIARADSRIVTGITRYMRYFGSQLQQQTAWQQRINQIALQLVQHIGSPLRDMAAYHIHATMQTWSKQELVREIEQHIGRDLQFIRINGTIIGGLIGLLLHAIKML